MKILTIILPLALCASVSTLVAQSLQTAPAGPVLDEATGQAKALGLKWNETYRLFDVPLKNSSSTPLKILGAQTSPTLFVVSFPDIVASGQQGTITLLYEARAGAGGDSDFVRLLTDQGIKAVVVPHQRERVVQFAATKLAWSVGEAANPKSVIVTVTGGVAMPMAARASGAGNTAQITPLGGGQFRISVTPGSTAKPEHFPVFIDFDPALPDVDSVLTCSVSS